MKTFITEDFLLQSPLSRELYHDVAKNLPIHDYHTHLSSQLIADNHQFANLTQIWIAEDHYKWRAMRSNGIGEKFLTGKASDYDKFLAFAKTVPATLRNPIYHWTHLELKNYFDFDELLNESTAPAVWEKANALLASPAYSPQSLLERSKVAVVCTTDDPTDDLAAHQSIRKRGTLKTAVYPTFRPDKALMVNQPKVFKSWIKKLESASGQDCGLFSDFLTALELRHSAFHDQGCRLSDHGLPHCFSEPCSEKKAAKIYDSARKGQEVSAADHQKFASYLMRFFGILDAKRGWTKQLHLGPMRNNNSRRFKECGPDIGCDSMGDSPQAASLSRYLDDLNSAKALPKTILYNLNPADNYVMGSMIGNFQDDSYPGKIQCGSAWWFMDHKQGIEGQINDLSNLGLLSRFVGMVTDSRSFLSASRHEYFRRILCNMIGGEVDAGELPHNCELLHGLVRDVCFHNARRYLGLPIPDCWNS